MDEPADEFPLAEPAVAGESLPPGVTIVVPTRRLAHHLRGRHDAACVVRGLATWRTPDVVTWADLVRRLFEADRTAGRQSARWLDPSLGAVLWEAIVERDADQVGVLAPKGLGARAQRSWTLLHEYQVPMAACREDSSPEVRAFAGWAGEYERRLRRRGWIDPAEATVQVRAPARDTTLELAGFDVLTSLQRATLQRFAAAGVTIRRRGSGSPSVTTRVLGTFDDFEAEIEAAARWLAGRLVRQPGANVALVVPALGQQRDRVRRILDRVLVPQAALSGGPAPESTAYELAAARPLVERPVIAAALAWLEAATGNSPLDALSALLRSPFDAGAAEADARAEFDAWLRRRQPQLRGLSGLAAHSARRTDLPETARRVERIAVRARDWRSARLPSRWVVEFFESLREVGWPGPAPDSTTHQAVQRFQSMLGDFAATDEVTGPLQVAAAVGHLRSLATDIAFEPQEIAAPMLVIDPDTASGMRFDAAWICSLDTSRWPAPAAPDPFLPRDWQSRQGVPGATAELAEAQSRRTLERLCASADEVVCSVAAYEDEAPLLPSALVAGLERWDPSGLWHGPVAAEHLFARRPALESVVDGALPPLATHEVAKGGAHLLELQAKCPFRTAVELRLGARELDAPEAGVSPIERGNLAHSVLQQVWETLRTRAALDAMPEDERRAWVAALAAGAIAGLRVGADPVRLRLLDLEQRWLEARVLELLQEDLQRPPFEVVHVETPFTVEVGGLQVRLKLDRVDRLDDGSLAVIDYKSGLQARPAAWMGERPELPQLPLYARAVGAENVGAVAFGVVRRGATGYLGYTRDAERFRALTPFDARKQAFAEYGEWPALLAEWSRRLDVLALEFARGEASLAPDPRKACRYCHLHGMCRIGQARDDDEEAADADAE
jgi:probable DNA repair protein